MQRSFAHPSSPEFAGDLQRSGWMDKQWLARPSILLLDGPHQAFVDISHIDPLQADPVRWAVETNVLIQKATALYLSLRVGLTLSIDVYVERVYDVLYL